LIPSEIYRYQNRAWRILAQSFKSDRLASTYLFYGPSGRGAWHLAVSLAALVNCENPVIGDDDNPAGPCDQCRNCRNIAALSFEGFHFALPLGKHKKEKEDEAVELTNELLAQKRDEPFALLSSSGSRNISIEVARRIKTSLSRKATPGIRRMAIFYQMERMLHASADALLKLIEEPPADTILVLTTQSPDLLLPTILSRSQKIRLDRIPSAIVTDYLNHHYEVSPTKAELLGRISDGSIGQAIEMLAGEDDSASSQRAVAFLLFKSIFSESSGETLSHMADLLSARRDAAEAEQLLGYWQSMLRDCANIAGSGSTDDIINVDFASGLQKLAPQLSDPAVISTIVNHFKNSLADLRRNVHIQGALMALVLKIKAATRQTAGV